MERAVSSSLGTKEDRKGDPESALDHPALETDVITAAKIKTFLTILS